MLLSNIEPVLSEALALSSTEKLLLIDKILASIYPVNKGVETVWNDESEERLSTYKNGNLPSIEEEDTLAKYKR